jgi:hypothetical protein
MADLDSKSTEPTTTPPKQHTISLLNHSGTLKIKATLEENPVFKLAVGKYWYASEYAELQAKRQEAFSNVEISVT